MRVIRFIETAAGPAGDANNDGTRHTYEDEFVEVVNLGPDAVDVAGWRLGDDDTSVFSWFEFPPATVLAPGERAVLFGGGSPQGFTPPAFVDDGRLGNGLTNGGDRLFLIDVAGDTVDSVSTISWPSDQSIVRPNRTCEPFVFHADPPGRGGTQTLSD